MFEFATVKIITKTKKWKMHVWIAKVPLFVEIGHTWKCDEQCRTQTRQCCFKRKLHWDTKMRFVKRFEVIDEWALSIDKIDSTLKGVKLEWQRPLDQASQPASFAELALLPNGSVTRYARIVRRDFANDIWNGSCLINTKQTILCKERDSRLLHLFKMKRFYNI